MRALDLIPLRFSPFSPRKKKEVLKFFSELSKESRMMYTTDGIDPETLYAQFRSGWKYHTYILVYYGKEMVGLVRLLQYNKVGKIEGIAVADRYQGKGIGTRIVKYIIALAMLNGIRVLRAEVKKENKKSYRLFSHLGFKVTKRDSLIHLEREL